AAGAGSADGSGSAFTACIRSSKDSCAGAGGAAAGGAAPPPARQAPEAPEPPGGRGRGPPRAPHRGEKPPAPPEPGADGGGLPPGRARLLDLAAARVGAAELEADRELALLPEVRRRECVREQVDGLLGAPLGERALAEHVQAVDAARGALHRALELADRVV